MDPRTTTGFEAWEVIMIAEREEDIRVLTNGTTLRRSYRDGHMMALNRGVRWCSNEEIVSCARRRD
jgi:hypothetical protein